MRTASQSSTPPRSLRVTASTALVEVAEYFGLDVAVLIHPHRFELAAADSADLTEQARPHQRRAPHPRLVSRGVASNLAVPAIGPVVVRSTEL
ncbi:hypothetical protein [Nocardia asiatica]|uniref:hypothetical protein n=1 Tax=Nocardia asiatica TaxID=209252 RepID=UPI003EE0FF9B